MKYGRYSCHDVSQQSCRRINAMGHPVGTQISPNAVIQPSVNVLFVGIRRDIVNVYKYVFHPTEFSYFFFSLSMSIETALQTHLTEFFFFPWFRAKKDLLASSLNLYLHSIPASAVTSSAFSIQLVLWLRLPIDPASVEGIIVLDSLDFSWSSTSFLLCHLSNPVVAERVSIKFAMIMSARLTNLFISWSCRYLIGHNNFWTLVTKTASCQPPLYLPPSEPWSSKFHLNNHLFCRPLLKGSPSTNRDLVYTSLSYSF